MTDEKGLGEKLKGVAKEAAGKATGQRDTEKEGEARQKKAQKAEEAERAEAEAEQRRREAAGHKANETRRR